jgi:hypothetical protein
MGGEGSQGKGGEKREGGREKFIDNQWITMEMEERDTARAREKFIRNCSIDDD